MNSYTHSSVDNPFRDIFRAMNGAGIRYLLVLTEDGFTSDLEVLLAPDLANMGKMTRLMRSLEYKEHLLSSTTLKFLSMRKERIDIAVLTDLSREFGEYDRRRVLLDFAGGLTFPVVSIDQTIMREHRCIDRLALRRDKEMAPEDRLDWLAAAWNFVNGVERTKKKIAIEHRP